MFERNKLYPVNEKKIQLMCGADMIVENKHVEKKLSEGNTAQPFKTFLPAWLGMGQPCPIRSSHQSSVRPKPGFDIGNQNQGRIWSN